MTANEDFDLAVELLEASECKLRREGVNRLLGYIDSRGAEAKSEAVSHRVQDAFNVLAMFLHTDCGCPGMDRGLSEEQRKFALGGAPLARPYRAFTQLHHECQWDPVSFGVTGICERIDERLYFGQSPNVLEQATILGRIANVKLVSIPVRVSFAGLNLPYLQLSGISLDDLSFHEAFLNSACLRDVSARRTNFSVSHWDGGIAGGNFTRSRWVGAYVPNCTFSGVFAHAHFDGAELRGASFRGADLLFAHFHRAIISGAEFSGCRVHTSVFDGAFVDEQTIFPDGMSIVKDGFELVSSRWPGIQREVDANLDIDEVEENEKTFRTPPMELKEYDAIGASPTFLPWHS